MGMVHARMLGKLPSIPKPTPPSSKEIVNKTHDAGDWLSLRSQSFWLIIFILVVAAIIVGLMKRPFVRGLIIGIIALAVFLAAFKG